MGDIVISCFPKIMDCPDIVEELAEIYQQDYWEHTNVNQKNQITYIGNYSAEIIEKLYPVLYAE
jgi:hypothetical protein